MTARHFLSRFERVRRSVMDGRKTRYRNLPGLFMTLLLLAEGEVNAREVSNRCHMGYRNSLNLLAWMVRQQLCTVRYERNPAGGRPLGYYTATPNLFVLLALNNTSPAHS